MFCEKCGTQFEGSFCPNCGFPVREKTQQQADIPEAVTPAAAPAPEQEPIFAAAPAGAGTYAAPQGSLQARTTPALEIVRRIGSSRLFLIAALLFAASAVFTLIRGFAYPVSVVTTSFTYHFNGETVTYKTSQSASPFSAVAGILPALVLLLGMFQTYFGAKNRNQPMPTAGLTIIKVYEIIAMVFTIIGAVLFAAIGGVLVAGTSNVNEIFRDTGLQNNETFQKLIKSINETFNTSLNPVEALQELLQWLAVFFFVLSGILVFAAVAIDRLLHTLNVVKKTIATGAVNGRISAFFAGLCYVLGVLSSLGILALLRGDGESVLRAISAALSGAAYLCFGVLQFQYRKAMRELLP